jgi:XTP/dITP diphosphohydrolase
MADSMKLLIATGNAGKRREIENLLDLPELRLCSLEEFPNIREAEETAETFAGNATLKALYYAQHTGLPCLADDSGLEVFALGGAPGVRSARYAGVGATDADRIAKLLHELDGSAERLARFVCVMAIAEVSMEEVKLFTGECRGRIALEPRGSNGFGYDPIFIPDGYEQTFAELSPHIKNHISHRARALSAVRLFLKSGEIKFNRLISDTHRR